ncbi:MAG: hypothetical protein ACQEUK_08500 [Pseudomonadota bacterium]
MALTPLQKETLANELIDVMERFQSHVETHSESYEAFIMQPSPDHIVIKIQPLKDTG